MRKIDSSFDRLCALLEADVSRSKEPVAERFVEILVFYGDGDLRPWLNWMENRFSSEDFSDGQKMAMACDFLDGKAAVSGCSSNYIIVQGVRKRWFRFGCNM